MTNCAIAVLLVSLAPSASAMDDGPWRDVSQSLELREQLALPYARYGERVLHLDLFAPASAAGPRPAIVLIHGGGWLSGDKTKFHPLARRLARRGFVVAAIEYRLGGESKFPAAIHDCHAAVRYLRARAAEHGLDPERIAAVGGSAGGHLAGLLASTSEVVALHGDGGYAGVSSKVQAAVVMAGPLQLAAGPVAQRSRTGPKQANTNRWLGKSIDQDPQLYRLASAITHFSESTPPILFQTGELDEPWRNAEARLRLRQLGKPTAVEVYADGAHGCWNQLPWQEVMVEGIVGFLNAVMPAGADSVVAAAPEIPVDVTPWLQAQWGVIHRGRERLALHVESLPENGAIEIPRLNNPIVDVYARGKDGKKGSPPLTLTPGLDRWSISLPEAFAAGGWIDVTLLGAPYLPIIPRVVSPSADDVIVLPAHDGVTYGKLLRYEPQPHKNTIGYWADAEDTVQWRFYVEQPGAYNVEVWQGCGQGQGGSEVVVEVGSQSLPMVVEDTGHFQNFKPRMIGQLHFEQPQVATLAIRVKKLVANAVMDVRQVKLQLLP